ncbi:MAG: acetate/propionate family kinase [Planctomycetia bacterium]|nr:acetate/propionate family kinase [Planctomycetia bacterium]
MKILVANIGSTSFKYQLLDMETERILARGAVERIGEDESPVVLRTYPEGGDMRSWTQNFRVANHADAVRFCFQCLTTSPVACLSDISEISGIGFKAVHAGKVTGVQLVTNEILSAMEEMVDIAPAHNPPYIAAMRQIREQFPSIPLVAAFETGFHADIPEANRLYAVPYEWIDKYQIRRYGFHGASHRFVAGRMAEIFGRSDLRIISCHLGGSSSLCAIRDGKSVASSMGGSPQGGLPQNNRVGDFDPYLIPHLMKQTGKSCEEILEIMSKQGGLYGLGGVGSDIRDILVALDEGNPRAKTAIDVYVYDIRRYLGAYMVELGGIDALVFTGGIGENQPYIRAQVCRNLEAFGIKIDPRKNDSCRVESCISTPNSPTQIWVVTANEEIVVARQTRDLLTKIQKY